MTKFQGRIVLMRQPIGGVNAEGRAWRVQELLLKGVNANEGEYVCGRILGDDIDAAGEMLSVCHVDERGNPAGVFELNLRLGYSTQSKDGEQYHHPRVRICAIERIGE